VTGPLTSTEPFPAPRSLPPTYDRHRPDLAAERAAVTGLGTGTDRAGLPWPELVDALVALATQMPVGRRRVWAISCVA